MAQQTAVDFIKEELERLGLLDKGEVMTNIFEQAKQMEKEQTEISDEEIDREAKQTYREHPNNPKEHTDWTYGKDVNFARKQKAFIKGAKWYREQLKQKL